MLKGINSPFTYCHLSPATDLTFTPFAKPSQITLGDSSLIPAFGTGVIYVQVHNSSKWTKVALHNVLYIPDLYGNLLSVPQITDRGAEVRFLPQSCSIYSDSGKLVGVGTKHGRLFTITAHIVHPHSVRVAMLPTLPEEGDPMPNVALFTQTSSVTTLDIWHRRLGHLSTDSVLQMARCNLVNGMQISGGSPPRPCEPCLKGKQTRLEIRKSTETCADHILGRIFTDVCSKCLHTPLKVSSTLPPGLTTPHVKSTSLDCVQRLTSSIT